MDHNCRQFEMYLMGRKYYNYDAKFIELVSEIPLTVSPTDWLKYTYENSVASLWHPMKSVDTTLADHLETLGARASVDMILT